MKKAAHESGPDRQWSHFGARLQATYRCGYMAFSIQCGLASPPMMRAVANLVNGATA